MAELEKIKTTAPKTANAETGTPAKECELSMEYPNLSLAELIQLWGEDVVKDLTVKQATIDLQGSVRRMLEQGSTVEEIRSWVADEWVPGVKAERVSKDPAGAVKRNLGAMTPEERVALFAEMRKDGLV